MSDTTTTTEAAPGLAKPLLKAVGGYAAETARCVAMGLAVSAGLAWVYFGPAGGGARGLAALLCGLVFPVLYGLAGHHRGTVRMLGMLTQSHGPLLYDLTLGRFIESAEARRPGALSDLVSSPGKFSADFKAYLADSARLPGPLKRVAVHYASRLGARFSESSLASAMAPGQPGGAPLAFRQWALGQMNGQLAPSWSAFAVLVAAQVMLLGGLWWFSR